MDFKETDVRDVIERVIDYEYKKLKKMEKLLRVAEMRDLEKQLTKGEISYSRMVEIINEKHFMELVKVRGKMQEDDTKIKELVKATLIIGAKRSRKDYPTTEELDPLIEQHIDTMTKRFLKVLKRA